MREALEGGAKVGIIAGTCSTPEERIADAALAALGPGLAEHLRIFVLGESMEAQAEAEASGSGQEESLERQFANFQAKVIRIKEELIRKVLMRITSMVVKK